MMIVRRSLYALSDFGPTILLPVRWHSRGSHLDVLFGDSIRTGCSDGRHREYTRDKACEKGRDRVVGICKRGVSGEKGRGSPYRRIASRGREETLPQAAQEAAMDVAAVDAKEVSAEALWEVAKQAEQKIATRAAEEAAMEGAIGAATETAR